MEFLQALTQNAFIVITPPNQWPVAIWTHRALGKLCAGNACSEPTTATLQSPADSVVYRFLRNFEPDREIERGLKPGQNGVQAFSLRQSARESVEHEPGTAMQTQPVFDQADDDFVRNQSALLRNLRCFQSELSS